MPTIAKFENADHTPQSSSPRHLSCSSMASSLHLDDLPEGISKQENASSGSADVKLEVAFNKYYDCGGSLQTITTDTKRREQIRLFKEYIFCCQSTLSPLFAGGFGSSTSNLSMYDDNESFERSDSTAAIEYGSFLPKLSGTRSRQSPATALPAMTTLFSHAGRDTPASSPTESCSSPVTAAQFKTTSSSPAGKGGQGAASMRCASGGVTPASPASRDAEACSVFRSQVAAALAAGRAVWL
jgi:hypothetical protein